MDPRSLRRYRRPAFLIATRGAIVAALASLVLLGACEQEVPEVPPGIDDIPEQQTHDYVTRHTKGGVAVWELRGRIAERFNDQPTMQLTGVNMVFYEEGEENAHLTSESAEVDERTEATMARGNVVVISREGRKLETEILFWDPKRELIHTDAFVRFTDGDQVLTGYGLETDPDLSNVVILRQVEGGFPDESAASEPPRR